MVAAIDGGHPRWQRAATVESSRQLWQQLYDTTDDTWVRNNAQLKLGPAQGARRHRRAGPDGPPFRGGPGTAPGRLERTGRDPVARGHSARPVGNAVRTQAGRPGRGRFVRAVVLLSPAAPVRERRQARDHDDAVAGAAFRAAGVGRRELPERLHLPPAPRSVAGVPGVTLHELPPQAELVRKRAGAGMARPAGAVPDVPRAASRPSIRWWNSSPASCSRGRHGSTGPGGCSSRACCSAACSSSCSSSTSGTGSCPTSSRWAVPSSGSS